MWTIERILALAPDDSSAKAGQGLSSPRKWSNLGQNERSLWGECQGSGSKPYQTQVDLAEPAFKCSCPSRKFPCKHAIGLFLMLGPKVGTVQGSPPKWVTDWIDSRAEKAVKKQERLEKAAAGEVVSDPAAQAKRAVERANKIASGLADLKTWMEDLVRQGFAQAQNAGPKTWEQIAARMVDAQAPGAARYLRQMGQTVGSHEGWHEVLLTQLARLYLLVQAYERLDTLPVPMQADVKTQVGVPVREEDLLPLPAVSDHWNILGQQTEEEDKLRIQRSWLIGDNTHQTAMILEFAFGSQPLKSTLVCGTRFEADLIFYPSATPLRAMLKTRRGDTTEVNQAAGQNSLTAVLQAYGTALAANPWIERYPMILNQVRPLRRGGMFIVDQEGKSLPLASRAARDWQLLSISGGQPINLFGEWDGRYLSPMSLWTEGRLHGLA